VYDVCHNIARMKTNEVDGEVRRLCIHRKDATRALPQGYPETPQPYREVGQPVPITGDMGRYSFVFVGAGEALRRICGSIGHGAGRRLSRTAAGNTSKGRRIFDEIAARGIVLQAEGARTGLEEVPEPCKDVEDVVSVVHGAELARELARKVARLVPMGVIKG
jgi:tRNA-splicing ligase RtcB